MLDPAVAALAFPVVMVSLMGIAFTLAAARGPAAQEAMSARSSVIYLAILMTYTTAAIGLVEPGAERLFAPLPDHLLPTILLTGVGVAAGYALLFVELELSLRLARRRRDGGISSVSAGGRGTQRAAAATAGRWFMLQAVLFAVLEELLWRGIGVREVQAQYGGAAEAGIIAAGVVLFGACHFYFGLRAVFTKSMCGLAWTGLTVLALGIIPALASHLAYQVAVARWNRRREQRRERVRAPLGATPA